jgi:hypothetical protein
MTDPSRRKNVPLAEGRDAFEKIIKHRHQCLGTDPTADLQRLDAARTAFAMWQEADQILAGLAADATMGCCTYTIDGQTSKIVMTQAECMGIPDPNRQWTRGPCPPP